MSEHAEEDEEDTFPLFHLKTYTPSDETVRKAVWIVTILVIAELLWIFLGKVGKCICITAAVGWLAYMVYIIRAAQSDFNYTSKNDKEEL